MGSHLESGNICRISRPSLQDPLWQESGYKYLEVKDKERPTRPSLQDFPGVFGPALSAGADYALRTQDDLPGISESNPGSALSSTGGFPSGSSGSPGPSSFSLAASAASSVAGILSCCSIVESLSGDREEKVCGTSGWHTGSSGSWASLQGKTTTLNRCSMKGKNKNQIQKRSIFNSEGKKKREEYPGGDFLADRLWVLSHRPILGTFSPPLIKAFNSLWIPPAVKAISPEEMSIMFKEANRSPNDSEKDIRGIQNGKRKGRTTLAGVHWNVSSVIQQFTNPGLTCCPEKQSTTKLPKQDTYGSELLHRVSFKWHDF